MDYAALIRNARRAMGWSQVKLAQVSEVSLPSIQNIEAGRANPSLSTLKALLAALDLEVRVGLLPVDWDTLAACGAPISLAQGTVRHEQQPLSGTELISNLRRALLEVSIRPTPEAHHAPPVETDRTRDALHALLLALHSHFPSFYETHFANFPIAKRLVSEPATGRTIKLRRLALAKLATYL